MDAKARFVELFKLKTGGRHPQDFSQNARAFADILNGYPELEELWQEAISELEGVA
jgi:hypothetical protein